MKKTQFVQVVSEYLQIGIGVLLASIGLKAFLLPNGFLDGGVTGIALLVSSQTSWDISILLMVLSIPFVVMGYFTLSKRIVVKSIIAISLLALLIKLEHHYRRQAADRYFWRIVFGDGNRAGHTEWSSARRF
mgnify:CR=1 FL=1